MYCKKCKGKIEDSSFFCQWCGERIDLNDAGIIDEKAGDRLVKAGKEIFEEPAEMIFEEVVKKVKETIQEKTEDFLDKTNIKKKSIRTRVKRLGKKIKKSLWG